jgi:Zn-dependent metalloprotease
MKRLLLLFVLTFLIPAPASAQNQPDAAQRVALDAFTARHGDSWRVRWNERTGTPASIFWGKTRPFKGSPVEAARAFLRENRELFGMPPDLSDLRHIRTQTRLGINHVKFQQTYQGLPVVGAEYLVHVHEDGGVDMANGVYYRAVRAPTRPALTATAALRIARTDLGPGVVWQNEESKLVVYPGDAQFHLTWKLRLSGESLPDSWIYYVDAVSGGVLRKQRDYREVASLTSGAKLTFDATSPRLRHTAHTASSVATGQGYVFQTHPGLNSSTVSRSLPRLDGSGYLHGTYVMVSNLVSADAFDAGNQFFYTASNTHFDEVNVYYHVDRFRNNYINALGSLSLGQVTARVHLREANAGFNAPLTIDFGDSIDLLGNPIP